MKPVDLHVHSPFSDGTYTPEELVREAVNKGLAAIALTDHDTTDGIPEAVKAAEGTGLWLIPGIEFSTFVQKKEIHIVGLFIDYENEAFNNRLLELKSERDTRNIKICQKFKDIGIDVSYNEMKEMYHESVITRAHFADYLLKKGIVHDRNEAFDRFIGDRGPCYVDRDKITPKDAIELIHSVGGVAVLAHPVLYHLSDVSMHSLMDYLVENNIQALEAIYSTYSLGEEVQMRNLAKEYNILISGGSDFHGANKPSIQLGTGKGHLFVPLEVAKNLQKLARH